MAFSRTYKVRQRGMALISALMVLIILAIIAGCFAIVMSRDVRQARNSMYQVICLNAAEAGIDYAIWLHRHNLACYPLVDYPLNGDFNKKTIPDFFVTDGGEGESDIRELAKGTVYNLPESDLKSDSGKNYDPADDRLQQYSNTIGGDPNKVSDAEFMFISDVSFWSSPGNSSDDLIRENFMHDSEMCATVQIRESIEEDDVTKEKILHIVSTGKIREVPPDYDWTDEDEGWLSLFSKSGSEKFKTRSLESREFHEYASRTVSVDLHFNAQDGVDPSNYGGDCPRNRQHRMTERNKREWFR